MSNVATVLGIITWCLIFVAIAVFILTCIIIYQSRQALQSVTLLLMCNTCSASLLTCLTMLIMSCSNLTTGFLTNNRQFCYAWGLFYDLFECSIYYSYCLQAIYHLCRIVFYQKSLRISYSFYVLLIVGQWLLVLVLLLPPIPLQWYIHLPTEKYCLIPYTNVEGEIYHIVILYVIPLVCISITYVWIIRFIQHSSQTLAAPGATRQRQRNLRDLTIVKNIVILISILVVLRFPTVIFMIYGIIAGNLYSLTYSIVGFITAACLIVIGSMTIYITPPLRKNLIIMFIHRHSQMYTQDARLSALPTSVAVVAVNHDNQPVRLTNIAQEAITEPESSRKY